jgi:hypothetical protein
LSPSALSGGELWGLLFEIVSRQKMVVKLAGEVISEALGLTGSTTPRRRRWQREEVLRLGLLAEFLYDLVIGLKEAIHFL